MTPEQQDMSNYIMHHTLHTLLQGQWISPDNGEVVAVPVKSVVIGTGLTQDIPALIEALGMGTSFLIVSDVNTYEVLGKTVENALSGKYRTASLVLGKRPEADEATANQVRQASQPFDAVIATGSGTINDICKYASFQDGKPYAVFGTAASMNGYSSANAAITIKGHKKTLQARLPQGIFLDLDILSAAPVRLTRSGLGDAICRTTCQADWLLSKHLRGTPYLLAPFALLAEEEPPLLAMAGALCQGDREAMAHLASTLVLSGFGMYLASGSYPASQGEHLIAHTMEMVVKPKISFSERPWPLHGEQVGVATLTMSRLQHTLLKKRPRIHADHINEQAIMRYFGKEIGEQCVQETRRKAITPEDAEKMNDMLSMYWLSLRAELLQVMMKTEVLETTLQAAKAATSPEQLGWGRDAYNAALMHAAFMRDRFTFLDLARVGR